ncbi:MAG: hypothetical protein ACYDAZ_06330 [Thermoplasmataceae archaeon]
MTNDHAADRFWNTVISQTLTGGHDGKHPFVFSKHYENGTEVPRPEASSFLHWGVGELKLESKTDWRASFEDSKQGFHVVEFSDRYECHVDKVDPDRDPLGHLVEDSPGTLVAIAIAGVAAIGGTAYYFYKKKEKNRKKDRSTE